MVLPYNPCLLVDMFPDLVDKIGIENAPNHADQSQVVHRTGSQGAKDQGRHQVEAGKGCNLWVPLKEETGAQYIKTTS